MVPTSKHFPNHGVAHADPFDDLIADPGPSKPLFMNTISSERPQRTSPPRKLSVGSDFGAFVSVPASSEASEHPLIDFESDPEMDPTKQLSPTTGFFDRFTEEAKHRAGKNERRVLNELLEHEDDPLYWINSKNDRSQTTDLPEPSSITESQTYSNFAPSENDIKNRNQLSESPPPTLSRHSSLSSSFTGTLSRKWMSNLLPHHTLPEVSVSPPQQKLILPEVTHASPFASHIFVPPSGAPGFTGDYHWNKSGFEFGEQDNMLERLTLAGRKETTTPVLSNGLADQLRSHLPALPRLTKSWSLLYSLDQHGVSLQTLYSRSQAVRVTGTIIAIKDSDDRIFGVWLGEQLRMVPGAYYGSGESFLWTTSSSGSDTRVAIFKWTGKNEYVALCDTDYISFGGGDGKYGLYLDANLTDGSSAPCPTFNNPVLCTSAEQDASKTVDFECVGIEVWGIST